MLASPAAHVRSGRRCASLCSVRKEGSAADSRLEISGMSKRHEKQLRGNSWDKPLLFDLYLFDKFLGLVGTGLEVRLNVKGTVKW